MTILLFPQNENVHDSSNANIGFSSNGIGRNPDGPKNRYGPQWLKFFNQIFTRLKGVESVAEVGSPNAPAAGAVYSQADTQLIVTELNETKAQLNALLTALKK